MRTNRVLAILSLAALTGATLTVTACTDASDGGGGGIGRVDKETLVKVITADDAKILDPHATSDGGNVKVINQIYQTLVNVDPTDVNVLLPELAESWEVSDDGLTVTLQIRSGVTFHDGAALDAAAAKMSLDRVRKAEGFDLPAAPYASEYAFIESMTAEGQTLTIKLTGPVARVAVRNLSMFCASIVSPKLLQKAKEMGVDAGSLHVTQNAAGTGPYKVDSFDPSAKVTRLVANEGYWDGAPAVKTVVFQSVIDESTRFEYLEKAEGQIVVDAVPRQHWKTVEASEKMNLHSWWALNLCYLGMNGRHEATKETEVRQAIQLAIARDKIVEHYEGTARPTFSLVAQPMGEYDPKLRPEHWDESLEKRQAKARELIEKVGAKGRKVTIYYPLQPRPYLPRPQDIADTVRQQLNAVGLEAVIQGEDKNKLFPGVATGTYDLILIGWMTDNGDPDNFYSPLADGADGEPGENNTSRTFDPEVHAKIVAAQTLQDQAKRVEAYREIERMLQARVRGYVPLVNTKQGLAYSATMKGLQVDGLGHYRFHKVTLTEVSK